MKVIALLVALAGSSMAASCFYTNESWWCGADGVTRYKCENGQAVKMDVCDTLAGCVDLGPNTGAYCSQGTGP